MNGTRNTDAGSGETLRVDLVEVGARDGLQNETVVLPTAAKVELIERLAEAGSRRIEVASFVHPGRVPQMADAEAVTNAIGPSPDGVSYIGLVLNQRGLERAIGTSVDEINFVVGASAGFNRANAGALPEATMTEIEMMLEQVGDRRTTVTISVAFGCPYDGTVRVDTVVDLATRAADAGADEIALGDTIGVAVPSQVAAVFEAVRAVIDTPLRGHFHDTRNTAVANAAAAYAAGVTVLDASVGGAGGCPFAPNATGNVATEDLVYLFERMGVKTGIDHDQIIKTTRWLEAQLGKQLPSAIARAGWWPEPRSRTP
ncbi:MAG: hydroxymethylglutaryl-CoA lyase [Actinomycetota bacterium]|nr:hydroxymethylglutaryl-CoA lyase [Actinomycetota bacterium]